MNIYPDWIGQATGGTAVPYPVLVDDLRLVMTDDVIAVTVEDDDQVMATIVDDGPVVTVELTEDVDLTIGDDDVDVEVGDV